jgi:drug/metabolite transporter (DMT)-like permease
MSYAVLALVLAAAAMHAGWNAVVKQSADPLMRLVLVTLGFFACGLVLVVFNGMPASASWPMLATSVALHQLYYALLVGGYRAGDLSTVYPISRGSAPAWVALGAWLVAGERVAPLGVVGIGLIVLAIASVAIGAASRGKTVSDAPSGEEPTNPTAPDHTPGWRSAGSPSPVGGEPARSPDMEGRAVALALATGVVIAGYSVADGIGGRASGRVLAYIGWLFLLQGIPLWAFVAVTARARLRVAIAEGWRAGLAGGVLGFLGYGIVIWAMRSSPMSYVSAVREVSVVLAAFIGTRVLGEPFGARRVAASAVVVLGVVLLQLSRAA